MFGLQNTITTVERNFRQMIGRFLADRGVPKIVKGALYLEASNSTAEDTYINNNTDNYFAGGGMRTRSSIYMNQSNELCIRNNASSVRISTGGVLLSGDISMGSSSTLNTNGGLFQVANNSSIRLLQNTPTAYASGNVTASTAGTYLRVTGNASGTTLIGDSLGAGTNAIRIYHNIGSVNITIAHESASATAANRFKLHTGQDVILRPNEMLFVVYDTTQQRWCSISKNSNFEEQTVVKTADESVTNSTVLQDDDHLFFTVQASKAYFIDIGLLYHTTDAAGGIALQITVPSLPTGMDTLINLNGIRSGTTITVPALSSGSDFGAFSGTVFSDQPGCINVRGILRIGSSGGTARLKWAQNASNASATTLLVGSYLSYKPLN